MKLLIGLAGLLSIIIRMSVGEGAEVVQLTSTELHEGINNRRFDAVLDVRRQDEWDDGHIEGATFVINLALADTPNEVTNASNLAGCEYCHIVVYCRSGQRAGDAIRHLEKNGFQYLYNGLGVSQWISSGFPLVTGSSAEASCVGNQTKSDECFAAFEAKTDPAKVPTEISSAHKNTGSCISFSFLFLLTFSTFLS